MSFISSFEIIKVAVSESWVFFWIPESNAEAAAVILNGAKIFFAKGKAKALIMTLKLHQIELFCRFGL